LASGVGTAAGVAFFAGAAAGAAPLASKEAAEGVATGMGVGADGGWHPKRNARDSVAAMANFAGRNFIRQSP
jgi:hypothetical protein